MPVLLLPQPWHRPHLPRADLPRPYLPSLLQTVQPLLSLVYPRPTPLPIGSLQARFDRFGASVMVDRALNTFLITWGPRHLYTCISQGRKATPPRCPSSIVVWHLFRKVARCRSRPQIFLPRVPGSSYESSVTAPKVSASRIDRGQYEDLKS